MTTIAQIHADFLSGKDNVAALVARQIDAVNDASGEGSRVFLSLNAEAARASATQSQLRFDNGDARPLEGITVSIKDLFDVAGEVTGAGSTVLRSRPAAIVDAPVVARLRAAGAIPFGRTNMVEFAFSGVGINPHFGTPRAVWGRAAGGGDRAEHGGARAEHGGARAPGGSSSGAAVSVADGMCVAALGSDTGGSVRIPAAFNGLVGFKPTAYRVPVLGAIPLSFLHDSVGPLATSVDCCARIDAVLANEHYSAPSLTPITSLRLLNPLGTLWSELDPEIESACTRAIETLRRAGATVVDARCDALEELFCEGSALPEQRIIGRLAETFDWHRTHVNVDGVGYDPRVWKRILLAADVTRAEVSQAIAFLRVWKHKMHDALAGFDAFITPTVACIAPEIAPLIASDELFYKTNARILRNTAWVNMMDGCALTLPCHKAGDAPVGLQLAGRHSADHALLSLGRACEAALHNQ